MTKKAILVTGIGGDIGEGIIKCLIQNNLGFEIYGSDAREYAPARGLVKKFFVTPLAGDKKEYLKALMELIEKNPIRYIFPSSEAEINFFHSHRDQFFRTNVTVMINDKPILEKFMDKHLTAKFLNEHNINAPKTFLLNEYTSGLFYPFILKKRRGSGSKLIFIVENRAEFDFYRKKYAGEDLIVQEYLGTKDSEYTIGVYADDKNVFSIAFKRYLASDAGVTIYAQLVKDPPLEDLAIRIARACQLRGIINIQARKTESGYIPFEINPRISGTSYVRHQFGFTDVLWWLLSKEGKRVVYMPKYSKGVAVRTISEAFFDLEQEMVRS